MIVLDTNVVSEFVRPQPNETVIDWVDRQPTRSLWITAMTAAELLQGIATMPDGARKQELSRRIESVIDELFHDRVVDFTASAAFAYANVSSGRRAQGRPIGVLDALIAASVIASGAELFVTRNTRDFDGLGIPLVNPWDLVAGT